MFSSWFRKLLILFVLVAAVIPPILVHAEEDIFQSAASSTEFANSTTNDVGVDTTSSTLEIIVREPIPEPSIRVGIYKISAAVQVKSDFVYEIWSGSKSLGTINPGQVVTLSYKKGLYTVKTNDLEFSSKDYIRLVPTEPNSFFAIVNYSRSLAGRSKINFNVYRGVLEYRFSPKSGMPYIINELPLEQYMNGVAEVNDAAPTDFIKALAVAARSYAYALISKTPPTEKHLFDVYATTVDQLYLGYNSEKTMPNFVAAVTETAGEFVTYKENPVITFYFTRSNGKTKSGGANRPWLKSVEAVYDKGKSQSGHGLGMSNQDAQARAKKDNWEYRQILEYYYSDTKVEKFY